MDSCRSEYDGLLFPPETVYGYPTKELVFFALMCQRHEISEKDLHDFCLGAENGWRCGYDDWCRTQDRMFQEAKERFLKGGDG